MKLPVETAKYKNSTYEQGRKQTTVITSKDTNIKGEIYIPQKSFFQTTKITEYRMCTSLSYSLLLLPRLCIQLSKVSYDAMIQSGVYSVAQKVL